MANCQGPPYEVVTSTSLPYPSPPLDPNSGVIQLQPVTVFSISQPPPQIIQTVSQTVEIQELPADVPGRMVCPHCQRTVMTETKHKNGFLAWMMCLALAPTLLCCWIALCIKAFKDVEHSCPNCNKVIHIHKEG
ncbi:lipopolysaccharide-induced tumor necrosis factor-alpha factor homolog [Notolabrus celidotus]|uniref:lipopolysaccharide-induced tumor necrosis factor-alpha factor homolog n=1 Tax=Notolabrus celidotus TaxID=1203425 RepID=UPI00149066F1|nr:lipopolysaccharide-induced tumor necrosis factor-alpha factor homolog [Notolabrus celidotus]